MCKSYNAIQTRSAALRKLAAHQPVPACERRWISTFKLISACSQSGAPATTVTASRQENKTENAREVDCIDMECVTAVADARIALPARLSEQEICFVGSAPWLIYTCSLLVAAYPATSVAYTSLQHPTAVGATESPRSSACNAWLPDLMKVKVWRGSGSRCQSDITVATQLSIDRWSYTIMQAHSYTTLP